MADVVGGNRCNVETAMMRNDSRCAFTKDPKHCPGEIKASSEELKSLLFFDCKGSSRKGLCKKATRAASMSAAVVIDRDTVVMRIHVLAAQYQSSF